MNSPRLLRLGAAVAILIGGLVHVQLYFGENYRKAGDANFGRSIMLNAIGSAVIAAAVAARKEWFVRFAGIGLAASTLVVFAVTHSGTEFLGFEGDGFEPAPQSLIALVAELATIVLLVLTFVGAKISEDTSSTSFVAGFLTAAAAIVTIGFGVFVANDQDSPATVPPGADAAVGAIGIADFAFAPKEITVAAGTTVTWTNADGAAHSIAADDGSFGSDRLATGSTFAQAFDTAGTFSYVCGIHPSMAGTITVTG